jgi:hypothetical protein
MVTELFHAYRQTDTRRDSAQAIVNYTDVFKKWYGDDIIMPSASG